jgi:hypothetical protein
MVRSNRPLVERMTLVWHDWFATSNAGVGSQRLMLQQNGLLRSHGLGSFYRLLLAVTKDPAMLLWLNGTDNEKDAPNENYGREMMELFTLGASRGYSGDVREQARALTGWRTTGRRRARSTFASTVSTMTPHQEDFRQAVLTGRTPAGSPSTTRSTRRSSSQSSGATSSRTTLRCDPPRAERRPEPLCDPLGRRGDLTSAAYNDRAWSSLTVYLAGMLRARRRGIDFEAWTWLSNQAGQRLLPAERRGLGRHALARHGVLARWNLAGRGSGRPR